MASIRKNMTFEVALYIEHKEVKQVCPGNTKSAQIYRSLHIDKGKDT